ncbi:MAG: zinc-ribbon domain-containing protein [Aeriscardovia sp.]|nr:zinc-ribbon domain-containing protein [Aeriscardovia sp.]
MYCTKCGNELDIDAKFCPKCGTPIDGQTSESNPSIPKKNVLLNTKKILILSGCIAGVICLVLFGKRLLGKGTDAKAFSLDKINKQCDGCGDALNTYIALLDVGSEFGYYEEEMEEYSLLKYGQMQHNCTADIIEVTDIPYVYHNCYGTYTGTWQGAGPTGQGTFIGKGSLYDNIVSYKGQWAYGLPEGEGELYIQNIVNSRWDETYYGLMTAGFRHGTGHLYEYYNPQDGSMSVAKYRIYDEATFNYDIMSSVTDCGEYDAETGEILRYYRMTGADNGWVNMIASWGADELNPDEKAQLQFEASVLTVGFMTYMVGKVISPGGYDHAAGNKQMLDELNSYNTQKEADEQAALEQQQKQQESYRNYCADQYDKLHAKDSSDWSLDAQYFKANMY